MTRETEDDRLLARRAAEFWPASHDLLDRHRFWDFARQSSRHTREVLLAWVVNDAVKHLDPRRRIAVDDLLAEYDAQFSSSVEAVAPRRHFLLRPWMWAAAASLLLLISGALWYGAGVGFFGTVTYVTGVGEQRVITLDDRSVIHLDALSQVKVRVTAGGRDIDLEGQAMFNVRHDRTRPFRVRAGGAVVEAIGTSFNVRTERTTTVTVIEGAVKVWGPSQQQTPQVEDSGGEKVTAGEAMSIDARGELSAPVVADAKNATAWEQRQLVFAHTPLVEIVKEFNRYSPKRRLHVEGESLGARRYGGVFEATDPWPLLQFLATDPSIRVEQQGDDLVLREVDTADSK